MPFWQEKAMIRRSASVELKGGEGALRVEDTDRDGVPGVVESDEPW
jgi:hypothetical protein